MKLECFWRVLEARTTDTATFHNLMLFVQTKSNNFYFLNPDRDYTLPQQNLQTMIPTII